MFLGFSLILLLTIKGLFPANISKCRAEIQIFPECSNSTINLTSNWSIPTGTYGKNQYCVYTFNIPEDSFAMVKIDASDWENSWFKFTNAFGYDYIPAASLILQEEDPFPPPVLYLSLYIVEINSQSLNVPQFYELSVNRIPIPLHNMQSFNLNKEAFLVHEADLHRKNQSYRLTADSDIYFTSICDLEDYNSVGLQNIHVLSDIDGKRTPIDTLESVKGANKTYPRSIIVYSAYSEWFSPCALFAISTDQKSEFEEVLLSYPASGKLWTESQPVSLFKEFKLNGTGKPSALVVVSRDNESNFYSTQLNSVWLLPFSLPNSTKLSVFGAFPSRADNQSQILCEFLPGNVTILPVYFSGFARTFIVEGGEMTVNLTEHWHIYSPLPLGGLTFNITQDERSLGKAEYKNRVGFAAMANYEFKMTAKKVVQNPESPLVAEVSTLSGSLEPIWPENGTVSFSMPGPNITLYPFTNMELVISETGGFCWMMALFLVLLVDN